MSSPEIKKLREKVGEAMRRKCSQEKFGQLLDVSWITVNRWEKGPKDPDPKNLKKLKNLQNLMDDENIEEILPYLETGNMVVAGSIATLAGAAATTAALLPMAASLWVIPLISKLMKTGQDE